jgi:hypothetical protein
MDGGRWLQVCYIAVMASFPLSPFDEPDLVGPQAGGKGAFCYHQDAKTQRNTGQEPVCLDGGFSCRRREQGGTLGQRR